ncbi:MAG: 3'-5' exonuclease [Coriobacteriales bacterium]|nr:3'-5' exonuclease [Coriobacteriales bacterium]
MKYDYNIAIDLEWTPIFGTDRPEGLCQEIIEIGAAKLGPDGRELDTFSELVKPDFANGITRRVRRITGIRNRDLTEARSFEEVLHSLEEWVGSGRSRMITWDNTDRTQILRECSAKGIESRLSKQRWLDLQKLYPRIMGTRRRQVALGEAADWCGIEFDKRHRAVYDARATGQIFHMAATGECAEQRRVLESSVTHDAHENSCTASIADRCGSGLAELFANLASQDTMAYA